MKDINTDDIPSTSNFSEPTKSNNNSGVQFTFRAIEEEEISACIKELDKNKGPGTDNISVKIIKVSNHIITSHLKTLFNSHINEGTYPTKLKIACATLHTDI